MADRNVAVELAVEAENLAASALGDVAEDLEKVGRTAVEVTGRMGTAFAGTGRSLAAGLGQAVENLTTGGDLGSAMVSLGGFMAGEMTQNFGEQAVEKLGSSTLVGALVAPMAGIGSTIGGALAAAIPAGMALAPVLIIGAIVAAIALLIVNEDIRNRVIGFAAGLVGWLVDTLGKLLGALPGVIGAAFGAAWSFILNGLPPIIGQIVTLWFTLPFRLAGLGLQMVQAIVGGLASLGGAIAGALGDAIRSIRIDIGPFHLSSAGFRIDTPSIPDLSGLVPHFALGTPYVPRDTFAVVHRGEAIIPAAANPFTAGGGGAVAPGVTILGVSLEDIMAAVDEGLYFQFQRAAPTALRS